MNIQAILQHLKAFRGEEKGVTTVEYAVMLVLVAIGVLLLGQGIDDSVTGVFTYIAGQLTTP